ncbi:MAG: DUF6748 domain-containing protein [Myxococcaceae bacterium]
MNRLFAAVAILACVSACGVSDVELEDDVLDEGSEGLSAYQRSFVTARRDFRKCMFPMCGGWYVADVNRKTSREEYVKALDFGPSGLSEEDVWKAEGAGQGELLLRGKLGQKGRDGFRTFIVSEAYRGMPGVQPVAGEEFYQANALGITCITAPCFSETASKLNSSSKTRFSSYSVARASRTLVDQEWLINRIAHHDAIVAGTLTKGQNFPGGRDLVLDASQVYLRLPEQAGPCPVMKLAACPEGKAWSFERNADRCALPVGCIEAGACAAYVPQCDDGYTLKSWTGGMFACSAYACDPTFTVE